MKKVKRFAVMMCCIFTVGTHTFAADIPTFKLNATVDVTEKNESVYVLADLSDNTGFGALQFCISYDSDKLVLETVTLGEIIPGDAITSINTDIPGEINFSAISLQDIAESGTALVSKFTAKESGSAKISLKLLAYADIGGTSLDANIEDAEIKITSDSSGATDSDAPKNTGGGSHSSGKETAAKADKTEKNNNGESEDTKRTFSDVPNSHWAKEYIEKAAEEGIVSGYENGKFKPDNEMTRAEFVTLLWNINGKPDITAELGFNDIKKDDWFYKQVAWGFGEGIITGTSETSFSPNDRLTREQAMAILYRCSGSPETKNELNKFIDSVDVSEYAKNAMSWAISNSIISGVSETELSPKTSATRAQLATVMIRFLNK